MSLKTVLVTIETSALAALRHAGHIIEDVVISIGQKLVAEVKQSDLGTRAMNLISELASTDHDGPTKMANLLDQLRDDVNALHAAGGAISGVRSLLLHRSPA